MDVKKLTKRQQEALLDLAMLAMYADGHLSFSEDQRVLHLLGAMGFDTEYDRGRQFDASISRITRHTVNAEKTRAHAKTLAKAFTTLEQQRNVEAILKDLVYSDNDLTPQESKFLSVVKEALDKAA